MQSFTYLLFLQCLNSVILNTGARTDSS